MQVGEMTDIVCSERACWTTCFPFRIEHKMMHDQLRVPFKQIKQTDLPIETISSIVSINLYHRKPATFSTQRIPRFSEFLLFEEEFFTRFKPFFSCHNTR